MLVNLPLVSVSMSDIFVIDVVTVISIVLCINFTRIHADNEVVLLLS